MEFIETSKMYCCFKKGLGFYMQTGTIRFDMHTTDITCIYESEGEREADY